MLLCYIFRPLPLTHLPEKVPEKTPGEWFTKLSMTAPGGLQGSAGDEA